MRRKLNDDPKNPRFIATRYGEGYIWVAKAASERPLASGAYVVVGPIRGLGVCGIASKLALLAQTGAVSGVTLLYAWNLLVTGFDAFLVYHYGRRARGAPEHALLPRLEQAAGRGLSPAVRSADRQAGETPLPAPNWR